MDQLKRYGHDGPLVETWGGQATLEWCPIFDHWPILWYAGSLGAALWSSLQPHAGSCSARTPLSFFAQTQAMDSSPSKMGEASLPIPSLRSQV